MGVSEIGREQEISMAVHPTFIHAAADLRRQGYLAEAATQWRERPEQQRLRIRRRGVWARQLLADAADFITWLTHEFEPIPAARAEHPPTRRLSGSALR